MRFDIMTIFPKFFDSFLNEAIFSRALKKKLFKIKVHNLRKWTNDRHQTVDGRPFGGGVGMVLKLEPIYKAVREIERQGARDKRQVKESKVILFSPRGKKFNQEMAKKWAKTDQLIFICGRYEGVDERVATYIADEVISVGDFVLSGGEVPAMIVMETISRLIPEVIGKKESAEKSDHAQYTRPEIYLPKSKLKNQKSKIWRVPKVLLSGDHKKIKEWREKHSN
jgi:tRNA (guanine37-N1)-methyltransferase